MPHVAPAGAQRTPFRRHTPSRTHAWPPQSPAVLQGFTLVPPQQGVAKTQGPKEPQAWSSAHVFATPGWTIGKYWSPTPRPAEAVSDTNVVSALRTASHFVRLFEASSSIESELSSMTYMSSGRRSALWDSI